MLRTCNVLRIAGLPVLRNDGAPEGAPRAGRSPALSRRGAPGRWTGLRPRTAREPPRRLRRHPSQEGNLRGRAGLKPAPTYPRDQRPSPRL
ncbi:MAG: hypothetical protein LBM98_10475 [Oscillospiraceae bacterium]|nr:hypothetical protein [Oscillospiraceae bacterium]